MSINLNGLLQFTDTGTWNHYVDSKVSSEDC